MIGLSIFSAEKKRESEEEAEKKERKRKKPEEECKFSHIYRFFQFYQTYAGAGRMCLFHEGHRV
jgi:hypothetical protein